ncbi:MAG: hypothetical protein DRO11_07735 [Methanobacteriota archaeon]|nr:MAG: hypothetical protein DRO11_07735 [Euryarchaeota archaeon]
MVSGGGFHGEPIGQTRDSLGVALVEIGNTSDQRIARLPDKNLSNGLPPFLFEKKRC